MKRLILSIILFLAPLASALAQSGQIASGTVLGNASGSRAPASPLSKTQLTTLCNPFTATLSGCVPLSGGGTTNFLRADGTWAAPATANLAVGSTPISGGTTLRVLFDNAGVLGEYTNTQLTALINPATATLSGALPAWPNNTTTFFRGDGTYQTLNCAALTNGAASCSTDATNANNITSGSVALARGGLGGSQAAATANQIPVYPGAAGAAAPTSAPTWFDNAYCNTIGYIIVRTTGAWTCSNQIPYSVTWEGAACNGSTDDTATIQAAINRVQTASGSGAISLPSRTCCIKTAGGITTTSGTQILGTSLDGANGGSALSSCNVDTTILTLNGTNGVIQNVLFFGRGSATTDTFTITQNTVVLGPNCVACKLSHVQIIGGNIGLKDTAVDAYLEDVQINNTYGPALLQVTGSGATAAWIVRSKLDTSGSSCPLPTTTVNAWAASTAYTTGQTVSSQGFYLRATNNGTSAGTQPTLKPYFAAITDNTVTWNLCTPTVHSALNLDSGASEVHVFGTDFSGFFSSAISMTNNGGGTAPNRLYVHGGVIASFSGGLKLSAGSQVVITGVEIESCAQVSNGCSGIQADTTFTGPLVVSGSTIQGNSNGIFLATTNTNDVTVTGTHFTCSGTPNFALQVAAGVSNWNFIGNNVRNCTAGLLVTTGASDHYNYSFNIKGTATITDNGSGANKTLTGNN